MNADTFYRYLNRQASVIFVVFLFVAGAVLSAIIPPFQSPDEFEHITRAYLLGKGEIVLTAPKGQSSGGQVDTGLIQYMESFSGLPFHTDKKLTQTDLDAAKRIEWTGAQAFRPALGMAYYFPGIYAVHALGLKLGEWLKVSVDASYRSTRALLLLSCCAILYCAFRLWSPPALVLALLLIPMSIFQFASASLDGIATALAVFVISAFFRLVNDRESSDSGLFVLLMMAWLLIASSRLQLFSMLLLPLTAGILLRRYWYVVITLVGAACVIAWQLLMMQTVVDGRVALGASTASIAAHYLQNPDQLFKVLSDTLTDGDRLRGYFSSFFGLLGWLDTPFAGKEYTYLLVLILLIFVCSISHRSLFQNKLIRTVLITCGLGSLAIIFFAMLVSWTPHPAKLIDGVQGRYFLIPAILFSYACCDRMATQSSVRKVLVFGLTASLGAYSLINTILLVFSRYY
jgi:uncharacterized membrane protein